MRLKHKPGDVMEVDWAGQTIPIYDPDAGNEDKAYLFITVLPFSGYGYAYVEVCADMKSECWIRCHMLAYAWFGGVTRLLIPDNLKPGVTDENADLLEPGGAAPVSWSLTHWFYQESDIVRFLSSRINAKKKSATSQYHSLAKPHTPLGSPSSVAYPAYE